ncbi:DUF6587 family protein [Achromobacter aloeverae]|uniref:Uncharacterized protein n=1 Tax=Achromobacter aloeverae TaxID=1750518 RepID=A0A4Q1HJU3_9BURK|nr:DUF6587 family protein [Achromobacter aloeverae]RXN90261.1 hypothetical protein C7R54_12120 [Achromobacter aloeverae]
MNATAISWQYTVVAIVLAFAVTGVLLHLFPRLHGRARGLLGKLLSHRRLPGVVRRAARRLDDGPRGGCAGCDNQGAPPRAIATVAMPATRRRKP